PQVPNDLTINNPTKLHFVASGIDGNVVQIFPQMLMTASTNEIIIDEIDRAVFSVEGIDKVNSYFRQESGTTLSSKLVYVANISFDKELTINDAIERIGENVPALAEIDGFGVGLVNVPQEITLTNPDLEMTKIYRFDNPLVQAYFSRETLQGDELTLTIESDFAGEQIYSIISYEEQNLTAAPTQISFSGEYELSSVKETLKFSGKTPYDLELDKNTLENSITQLDGISSSEASITPAAAFFTVMLDGDYQQLQPDLEMAIEELPELNDPYYSLDTNKFFVNFSYGEDADYSKIKSDLLAQLEFINFGVKELIEPTGSISGSSELSGRDMELVAPDLKQFLETAGVTGVKINAIGEFAGESFTDLDTNKTYILEEGFFDADISLSHAAGDKIELEITVVGSRDKALYVIAAEK
ncbi:MAG: hypothetical protein ABID38_01660, partial [Candidatus Diapherotrites archaeon]